MILRLGNLILFMLYFFADNNKLRELVERDNDEQQFLCKFVSYANPPGFAFVGLDSDNFFLNFEKIAS